MLLLQTKRRIVGVGQRRGVFSLAAVTLLFSWSVPQAVQAAAGDLDPTFGSAGKVVTDFGGFDDARAIAIQADGKIIAAGAGGQALFVLARYNLDGSLDSAFGSGGKVATPFPGAAAINAITIQDDGRIVAVGGVFIATAGYDFAIARYLSDGSPDYSFGSSGHVITDLESNSDVATGVAMQASGKILVVGSRVSPTVGFDFALIRYNVDGSLDGSFGVGGRVITALYGGNELASGLIVQPDDKVVVAGTAINFPTGFSDFALVRYDADGTLDDSFGSHGKATAGFVNAAAFAIGIQSNGKLIAAGTVTNFERAAAQEFALVRYGSDGSLDTSFGSAGKTTTPFFGISDVAKGLAIQVDGRIVVCGSTLTNPTTLTRDFALARYNADGMLDVSFGSGGKVTTDFFGSDEEARGVAVQKDGRVVVAGGSSNDRASLTDDFELARYKSDGTSFNTCLQDDSAGTFLQFNSTTGDYQFNSCGGGTILTGRGTVQIRASVITLEHFSTDRRVLARIDNSINRGAATVQILSPNTTFTITDRDTRNDTCDCR